MPYQIKLPFSKDTEYGFAHIKTINDTVFQGLKMLLLTIPGEKINDPEYGCGLLKYVFDYDSENLRNDIKNNIFEQVSRYMPFINLSDINFQKKDEILYLSIKYYIGNIDNNDLITIPLNTTNV